jgi:uncharacterized protein YndB with AHSA1/START domain
MSKPITLTRVYPYPPERVWRALTDPAALSEWLMPTDFEPRVGHRFQFKAFPVPGWRGVVDCEVLELEPPRRMVLSWAGHEDMKQPTRVTWTLEPDGDGTRLTLQHAGFRGVRGMVDRFFLKMGLHKMYDEALPRALERVTEDGYQPYGYWFHDRARARKDREAR